LLQPSRVLDRIVVLIAVAVISGAALANEDELARGAALLSPLKNDLKQALVAGLETGPVNAITVCRDQAPMIASALSVDGVEMGRSSHRLRNPANLAPDWVSAVLETYQANATDRTPQLVRLEDDRLGYIEPIMLQGMCVVCHGKVLAPEVVEQISESYPEDRATGFEVGDLRGVYWVEFPARQ